ncbi:MAG: Sec-independent protein translocase protein TatB [Nitrospiraceae bacterium]|nr:Sec-independent protein translocase protein TatB [Nitrospiraceae bacterium]
MFDIGFQELIVIFVIALLVFGPKKLPELARTLGKGMAELKRAFTDAKLEIDREVRLEQEESEKKGSLAADPAGGEQAEKPAGEQTVEDGKKA